MTPTDSDPIVVTGMGAVTPLGVGAERVWQRLLAGQSGIGAIQRFDVSDLPAKIAGQVPLVVGDGAPKAAAVLLDLLASMPELQNRMVAAVRVGDRRWNLRMRWRRRSSLRRRWARTRSSW